MTRQWEDLTAADRKRLYLLAGEYRRLEAIAPRGIPALHPEAQARVAAFEAYLDEQCRLDVGHDDPDYSGMCIRCGRVLYGEDEEGE